MNKLKNGHYYWVHHIRFGVIYLAMYNYEYCEFWFIASDENLKTDDLIILGEVEVPDFIDKNKLESKYE